MKRLLIGLLFASTAFAGSKDVTVTTDRFTGETSVALKAMSVATDWDSDHQMVQFSVAAICSKGKIMLAFISYARTYKFLDGADVLALVDGERIDLGHFALGNASVSTTSTIVLTNEIIAGYVDRATLNKLVNAKDVQLRVGTWEMRLKPKNVDKLKEFAMALPAGAGISK